MIDVFFTPSFDRTIRKLDIALIEEISDTVELLKDERLHARIKVHKLHGRMKGFFAASVDYRHRIVFRYVSKTSILLVDFGDHSVYE